MVTEALVNLGKAIQKDPFIMDLFTDHENPMHKWYDQTIDYLFLGKIICSLGMLLGFVLRCFSSVYVLSQPVCFTI